MSERERRLLRLLTGEASADEARTIRADLDSDPELAARFARLQSVWEGLELPEPAGAPPGFARRVTARLPDPSEPDSLLGLAGAPIWARTAAALALTLGLATGWWVGRDLTPSVDSLDEVVLVETEPGLADAYRRILYGEEP